MPSTKPKPKYRDLSTALQAELEWFEGSELDIDEAILRYKRAGQLIKQMQSYLSVAKSEFEKVSKPKSQKR